MKAKRAKKSLFRDRRSSKTYMVRRDSGFFPKYRRLNLDMNDENSYEKLGFFAFLLFYEPIGELRKFAFLPKGFSKKKQKKAKIYKPNN